MKKSRIVKFALLGASTAALVGTLSTSTYAWYVTSKSADVTKFTGQTAAAGSDDSIGLSLTGNYKSYKNNIALGNQTDSLSPVYTTNGVSFKNLSGDTTSGYYTFTFYMESKATQNIKPVITIKNITETMPLQPMYATTHIPTGVTSADEEFTSDATKALFVSQTITVGTVWANNATKETTWAKDSTKTPTTTGNNALDSSDYLSTTAVDSSLTTGAGKKLATAGAHDYYDELTTGDKLTDAQRTTATMTGIGVFSLTANTPVKIEYRIWLDGASDACFNSCAGQKFEFKFDYSVTA